MKLVNCRHAGYRLYFFRSGRQRLCGPWVIRLKTIRRELRAKNITRWLQSVSRSGLTSSLTYVVSYWSDNNSALTIPGTISGYPGRKADRSRSMASNGVIMSIKLPGSPLLVLQETGKLDELRLYPEDSGK